MYPLSREIARANLAAKQNLLMKVYHVLAQFMSRETDQGVKTVEEACQVAQIQVENVIKRKRDQSPSSSGTPLDGPPSKKAKIEANVEPIALEEISLRFPHLEEQIFAQLDNQSLVKCRKISRNWANLIDSQQKMIYIRKIQANILISNESIVKTLSKESLERLIELEGVSRERNETCGQTYGSLLERFRWLIHSYCQIDCPNGNFIWELMINNMSDKRETRRKLISVIILLYPDQQKKLETLLRLSDDKNPASTSGSTPLHLAALLGRVEHFKLILRYAVNKNPVNNKGMTPFDVELAQIEGCLEICDLIKSGWIKSGWKWKIKSKMQDGNSL